MHDFLAGELPKLGLDQKHIRREFVPAPGSPEYFENYSGDSSKVFTLSLQMLGEKKELPLRADETVLTAIERAGIAAPSRCRSGECGWCRSRLISGDVFIPESMDGRRLADDEAGYIHPCSTWALSNLELEIFPEFETV
jgi:ferredoxin